MLTRRVETVDDAQREKNLSNMVNSTFSPLYPETY